MWKRQTGSCLDAQETFSEFLTHSLLWNRCQICGRLSIILMPSNPVCFRLLTIGNIFPNVYRDPAVLSEMFWDGNKRLFLLIPFVLHTSRGLRSPRLRKPTWKAHYEPQVISNLCRSLWDTKEYKMWSLPIRNLYSIGKDFWDVSGKKWDWSLSAACGNSDHYFMIPLSQWYPIMHNHIIPDPDKTECLILWYRHCVGQHIIWRWLFKTDVSAKGVRAGEISKNWLPPGQRRCDGLDFDVLKWLILPLPKNMCWRRVG